MNKLTALLLTSILSLSMLSACGKAGMGTHASEDGGRDTSGSGSVSEGWKGPGKNPDMEECGHGVAYAIDNENMVYSNVDEYTPINHFIAMICFATVNGNLETYHYAEVYMNGNRITKGYIEEGMRVKVYHEKGDDIELYGEYTIAGPMIPRHFGKMTVLLSIGYEYKEGRIDGIPAAFVEEGTTVQEALDFLHEFDTFTDSNGERHSMYECVILDNGQVVSDGLLKEGMTILRSYSAKHKDYFSDNPDKDHTVSCIVVFI
ncbi:MAG: hypothetical protein FWH14_01185 [Oscillospiraceae bacterium]|nr:hypothetical protein [Oscillospiraceae bacterium]